MWQRRYRGGKLKKDKPNIFVSSRIANRFILDFLPVSFKRNVRSLGRIRPPRVPLFKYQSWSTANIGERSFLMVQHYFPERPKCDWLWRMYLFQKQTVWIKTFFFSLFVLLFYESSTFSAQDGSRDEVQIRYAPTRMKYIQVYFKYTKFPFVEYWALT